MKISVLMSAYNGEKYILEQLESLYMQTIKIDELIVIDDCSSDKTYDIVMCFIYEHSLQDYWKIIKNNNNKGWKYNFINGLNYVSGDVLFYTDQDDIWFLDKIEKELNVLNNFNNINVVASKEILWDGKEKSFIKKKKTKYLFPTLTSKKNYMINCSGCTMAIRMSYAKKILSYYTIGCAHDDFFWKYSIFDNSLCLIGNPTLLHRIHSNNESRKKRNYESSIKKIDEELLINKAITEYVENSKESRSREEYLYLIKLLIHKKNAFLSRKKFLVKFGLFLFLKLLFAYNDIYRYPKELIKDFLLSKKRG